MAKQYKVTFKDKQDESNVHTQISSSEKLSENRAMLIKDGWDIVSVEAVPEAPTELGQTPVDAMTGQSMMPEAEVDAGQTKDELKNPYEWNSGNALGRGLMQGVSLGWGDEIAGKVFDEKDKKIALAKNELAQQGSPAAYSVGEFIGGLGPDALLTWATGGLSRGLTGLTGSKTVAKYATNPGVLGAAEGVASGALQGGGVAEEGKGWSGAGIGGTTGLIGSYLGGKLMPTQNTQALSKVVDALAKKEKFVADRVEELTKQWIETNRLRPQRELDAAAVKNLVDEQIAREFNLSATPQFINTKLPEDFANPVYQTGANVAGAPDIINNLISGRTKQLTKDVNVNDHMSMMRATKGEKADATLLAAEEKIRRDLGLQSEREFKDEIQKILKDYVEKPIPQMLGANAAGALTSAGIQSDVRLPELGVLKEGVRQYNMPQSENLPSPLEVVKQADRQRQLDLIRQLIEAGELDEDGNLK
jgi:hypothetical protein